MFESIISGVMPVLVSIASASITAAIPVAMIWLNQHLALSKNAILNSMVSAAVARGAGIANGYMNGLNTVADSTIHEKAIAVGVNYVYNSFPDALTDLGVTSEHVTQMVTAEVGKLSTPAIKVMP